MWSKSKSKSTYLVIIIYWIPDIIIYILSKCYLVDRLNNVCSRLTKKSWCRKVFIYLLPFPYKKLDPILVLLLKSYIPEVKTFMWRDILSWRKWVKKVKKDSGRNCKARYLLQTRSIVFWKWGRVTLWQFNFLYCMYLKEKGVLR